MVDAPAIKQMKKKGELNDDDVCHLLQRYSVAQVLALLREVAQSADEVKIDWNAMVKKTETGITNAREFQLLWRHIAYRHPLAEKFEEGDQPLDDDSDIEYELEPFPPVSTEFSTEVANCVKVLAFGSANESSMLNSSAVESEMSNGHLSKPTSENRHPTSLLHNSNTSLTVPPQKQPQAAAGPSGDGFDSNYPSRRKRKPWSEEEDLELVAAVKKFGESNWANIVKGEFKGDRTASQLSQRWQIIKKRKLGLNTGSASSAEVHLATRRAIDMALKDNLATTCGTVNNGDAANNNPNPNAPNGDTPTSSNTVRPGGGAMGIKALPRPPVVKKAGPTKPPSVSDSIQAAAVAAGARIASPSDAANILKATQSKNAVRIMGGGATSLVKSTSPTVSSSPLPPNVHFIRTGLASTSMATGTLPLPPKGNVLKPSVPATAASLSHLPKAKNAPSSTANEPKQVEQKTSIEAKVPVSNLKGPESTSDDTVPSKPTCATSKDTSENEAKHETSVANEKKSTVEGSSVVNGGDVQKVEASNETGNSDPINL